MILGMEIGLDYVSKPIFNACTKDAFCFSFLQGRIAGVSDYSHAQACHKAQDQQFLCYP